MWRLLQALSLLPSLTIQQRNKNTSHWVWATYVVLALAKIITFFFFWGAQQLSDEQCWARMSSLCKLAPTGMVYRGEMLRPSFHFDSGHTLRRVRSCAV